MTETPPLSFQYNPLFQELCGAWNDDQLRQQHLAMSLYVSAFFLPAPKLSSHFRVTSAFLVCSSAHFALVFNAYALDEVVHTRKDFDLLDLALKLLVNL